VLNPWSIKAFNAAYYAKNRDRKEIVDFNSFYYPLDGIEHWNRIYGRRGFVQYQALFPSHTAGEGLHELLECISQSRQASFLAVLKGCGEATPGMLSYLFPGNTLALDFPYRGDVTRRLFARLDEIVLKHSGRLYLAKDALTDAETFSRMYPRLNEFQAVKRRVDPENRFVSSQAKRLGLIPEHELNSTEVQACGQYV
jgi:FAD/FMN-containing dehydrogenase